MNVLDRQLKAGWYFLRSGELYQIKRVDSVHLGLDAVHVATQVPVRIPLDELVLSAEAEQVRFAPSLAALQAQLETPTLPAVLDESSLPEALLKRADRIIHIVESVEQQVAQSAQQAHRQGQVFQRTRALQAVLDDIQLSLSRYYDYRKRYLEYQGNRAAIEGSLRRSTFNQSRIGAAERHLLETLILRYYARTRPLRPQTLYRLAKSVLTHTGSQWLDPTRQSTPPNDLVDALLNPRLPMTAIQHNPDYKDWLVPITLPSQSWFYQYLRWFEHQPDHSETVLVARYGRARWEQEHLIFDSFVTRATAPLQYVFADHWLLDVFTVDEESRSQVNRLWFTALIDAFSRSILGVALLYETPCIESIQSALCHAIWPKPRDGISDKRWLCYGIPQQLSLDNAWAHHSHSLEQLARSISGGGRFNSIDLVFRPPYKGRYGALIERFFGNLSAQVKEHLPGALNGQTRAERLRAAQTACLLYADLDTFLTEAVIAYHHTPHRELNGMTPQEKWLSSWQGNAPLVPPYTALMERLFWRRYPEARQITREGIHAFGLTYTSVELAQAQRIRRDGQPVQYSIHYDPQNINCLALFQEGQWVTDVYARELRLPDGNLRTLSVSERDLAKTLAQHQSAPERDWLTFLNELDTLSDRRQREKRRKQRSVSQPPAVATPPIPNSDEDSLLDSFLKD